MNRYHASLNGKSLSALSDAIIITDIRENVPEESITTQPRPFANGMRFLRKQRQSISVTIALAIATPDVEARKSICIQVQRWARNGGILRINDRDGQYLSVVCTQLPTVTSAMDWQQNIEIVLTAYEDPFWQSSGTVSVTTTGLTTLMVPGTAETVRGHAVVTNTGAENMTTVSVRTSASVIAFSSLSIAPGGQLEMGYDDNGIFYARVGDASALGNRSVNTDDDLLVAVGRNDVRVTSNTSASLTLTARGAWL